MKGYKLPLRITGAFRNFICDADNHKVAKCPGPVVAESFILAANHFDEAVTIAEKVGQLAQTARKYKKADKSWRVDDESFALLLELSNDFLTRIKEASNG